MFLSGIAGLPEYTGVHFFIISLFLRSDNGHFDAGGLIYLYKTFFTAHGHGDARLWKYWKAEWKIL